MTPSSAAILRNGDSAASPNLRVLTPRWSLPGSRSIVGGVLVAVAVLGTYAAATQTGKDDTHSVVIAARDIAPGTRLQATDFRVVKMELSPSLSDHVLQSPSKLAGATVLGPLTSGDVIQPSLIATAQSTTPYFEVSFSLPASRALDGVLRSGETVDILVTDKANPAAIARSAASDVRVLRTQDSSGGGIGKSADITLTVGVNSRSDAAAVAAAVDQGDVTLVRTTGLTNNE